MTQTAAQCNSHGWADKLAISMAGVCAVHCLLTPVLVVMLPILATSFFVHQDFHLWMLYLVIPTTSFAIFMGCRKHKDKWVAALSAIGLSVLIFALVYERQQRSNADLLAEAHCEHCVRDVSETVLPMNFAAWINTLGGLFLAGGHIRNYRLCRRAACSH
jgi:hypothetical protein